MPGKTRPSKLLGFVFMKLHSSLACFVSGRHGRFSSNRKKEKTKRRQITERNPPQVGKNNTDLIRILGRKPLPRSDLCCPLLGWANRHTSVVEERDNGALGFFSLGLVCHRPLCRVGHTLLLTGGGLLYRVKSRVAKTVGSLVPVLDGLTVVVALSNSFTKTPMGRDMAIRVEKRAICTCFWN